MILKAKHHPLIVWFFEQYVRYMLRKHFSRISVSDFTPKTHLPVLILANHISWWDGFWVMHLNRLVFKKKFHVMMLEEQLLKYKAFNYAGAYSIHHQSKTIIESLQYTADLLTNPSHLVLMFPEGKIQSMHQKNIHFQKGIEKILKNIDKNQVQIVFVAHVIDYYSQPKPSLSIFMQEYCDQNFLINDIESAYQTFYNQSIEKQLNIKE